jgi:hypothetical protein
MNDQVDALACENPQEAKRSCVSKLLQDYELEKRELLQDYEI